MTIPCLNRHSRGSGNLCEVQTFCVQIPSNGRMMGGEVSYQPFFIVFGSLDNIEAGAST